MHWFLVIILHCGLVHHLAVCSSEISKSRPSNQSFVPVGHESWRAFDGNPLTYSSTLGANSSDGGWIQVDLGGFYNIRKVVIINAPGNDSQYLVNFQVLVGTTDQVIPEWMTCFVYTALPPLQPGATYSSECDQELTLGRYVTIQKHGGPYKEVIVAAEIMVYGIPSIPAVNLVTNVAKANQTFRDYPGYEPMRAIDGNVYTCAFTATESVSIRNTTGRWQVDLGEAKKVTACLIANVRKEFFEPFGYMKAFAILVSNDSGAEFIDDHLCLLYNSSEKNTKTVLYLPCSRSNLIGRYITVINMYPEESSRRMDVLTICEFYAFDSSEGFELPVTSTVITTVTSTETSTTVSTATPTEMSTTVSTATPTETSTTVSTATPTEILTFTSTITSANTTIKSITTTTLETSSTLTIDQSSITTYTLSDETTFQSKLTILPITLLTSALTTPSKTTTPGTTAPTTTTSTQSIPTGVHSTDTPYQTNTSVIINNSIRDDDWKLRLGLGIGLGLGLGLLLLIAILLILLFCCFCNKKRQEVPINNKPPISINYVHPRTRLAPQSNAFDYVDFSYVPDLKWEGSEA